jgi:hypothetical protein
MLKVRVQPLWLKSRAFIPLLIGLGILAAFLGLNHGAYDGFFQDDELDNLQWAPLLPAGIFIRSLLMPRFEADNFRPVGHLYFALMGRYFGLDFPPYMTPVFAIHLINALLLFLLIRKLGVNQWCALAASAFFTLSATAFDAYWKPMYVFDLLCTTFSLGCILLYACGRRVLSFLAFWLAYKSKELAVMLPAVLVLYEYWFGARKFKVLILFLLAALNFGLQGIFLNPNRNNPYAFRFTAHALEQTVPFYARRFLLFPLSGLLLFGLALIRDRRIWFGLAAMCLVMVPLLFLPGRLYEAYAYLPLACAAIAIAAAASRLSPVWIWLALAVWMPFNIRQLRQEGRAILDADDQIFAFVDAMAKFAGRQPDILTFIYDGRPANFHDWGVKGAWSIIHRQVDRPAFYVFQPGASSALASQTVAYGSWDGRRHILDISIQSPHH